MDRLTNLPDPIRNHIVSFLPLKDAIRTTILSRRWMDICCSLSNLDFVDIDYRRKDFKDIIDQTLFLHNGLDIERFRLGVKVDSKPISPLCLSRWISFVLRHHVSYFDLYVYRGEFNMLPSSFFTSSTLTTLKLSGFDLKLPSRIQFPALKTIAFFNINFCGDYLSNTLFSDSCCPMLEKLVLQYCYSVSDDPVTLSICATSLKSLTLYDSDGFYYTLSCPNLHELYFDGDNKLPDISFETLSSLSVATFVPNSGFDVMENLTSKTLMGMHNLHTLELRGNYIEGLARLQSWSECWPISYCGLKHLHLSMFSTKNELQVLTFLLRSYPKLQRLYIKFYQDVGRSLDMLEGDWQYKELSTVDMLKHLRTIEINNLQGTESELDLVRYMLENANILEALLITCVNNNVETHARISRKLLTFARVSHNAKIFLS